MMSEHLKDFSKYPVSELPAVGIYEMQSKIKQRFVLLYTKEYAENVLWCHRVMHSLEEAIELHEEGPCPAFYSEGVYVPHGWKLVSTPPDRQTTVIRLVWHESDEVNV